MDRTILLSGILVSLLTGANVLSQNVTLPTPEQTTLLERYKPRVFLPEGHEGPIDFYQDYIANGELVDRHGDAISNVVDQALLTGRWGDGGGEGRGEQDEFGGGEGT